MGNSNYFDELIVSYLSHNLNTEEETFVLDWINSSEQNKQYFEELKNTWNLLLVKQTVEDTNIDSEWDQFKQVISTKEKELNNPGFESSAKEVAEEIKQNRKASVFKIFVSTAVAASIVLIIALGWRFSNNNLTVQKPLAFNLSNETQKEPFIRTRFNTTDKPILLILQDGSKVELFGKSEISYPEPFIGNKRDITLAGKANFKVAKDKTKPFTVFSGDISTTALGTQFTVTAIKKARNITVRLYEGKVVVKLAKVLSSNRMDDVYLVPRQELVYDVANSTATVRSFGTKVKVNNKEIKKDQLLHDNPVVPSYGKKSWFMFNNQSLSDIFDDLASMYKVKINYSKKEINKMYFIGTFDKSDSLEYILKQIASINNLSIIQDSNTYRIKKQDLKPKN